MEQFVINATTRTESGKKYAKKNKKKYFTKKKAYYTITFIKFYTQV